MLFIENIEYQNKWEQEFKLSKSTPSMQSAKCESIRTTRDLRLVIFEEHTVNRLLIIATRGVQKYIPHEQIRVY